MSDELRLQPLVHVNDLAEAVGFYAALGGEVRDRNPDGDWAVVRLGGGEVGLLAHPPNPEQGEGPVELTFVVDPAAGVSLETVEGRLRGAGIEVVAPVTEAAAFGRQLLVRSPDGLLVKINEFAPRSSG